MTSQVTGIENLSKTRTVFPNELSFADRGLKLNTRADAKELVDAILKAEKLPVIRLEGNTISPEAAEELSKALEKHPELERFIGNDLFTGRLKDEIPLALKSIFGAIDKSGAHLVELNLADNAFGPIGLEGLVAFLSSASCYSLKEIRMHNNGLGPQGGQKFALALEKCYENSGQKLALKTFICGRNRLEFEGSKALSAILLKIGTLEEIQMPQNGIRPNAIENIAQAFAGNKSLRIVSLNDNTLGKIGGEFMAKALTGLKNLEYVNFGDCLLKSKGAVQIARGLANSEKLIEVILSFNEVNLNAGIDIAKILVNKKDTLKLLDLNGNKFGEEGKLEIQNVLAPIGSSLATLSEDEGSDEEDEEDEENVGVDEEDDEEDEEEVDDEDEEDYENYDGEEDDEEDGSYDEEEDDEEEEDYDDLADNVENTVQIDEKAKPAASSLFTQLKPASIFSGGGPGAVFGQPGKSNPFENMTKNKHLFTQIKQFDAFVLNPNLENLLQIDEPTLTNVCQSAQFNGIFLVSILDIIAKVYQENSKDSTAVLNTANTLVKNYLEKSENVELLSEALLTYFGLLKSEDKAFKPVALNENTAKLFQKVFSQGFVPKSLKEKLVGYVNFRASFDKSPLFANNSEKLKQCF